MARLGGVLLVAALAMGQARPASAQEAGSVGLTMGYPAAVGVLWHITGGLAVRPDLSLSWTSSESVNTSDLALPGVPPRRITSRADSFQTSIGVSALVYVHTAERLRLYVAPRVAYLRTTVDLDDDSGVVNAFDTHTDGYLVSGSLGAQAAVHERFAVFGEVGLQFTSQRSSSSFSTARLKDENRSVGLRSAVGVTLYF